MGNDSVQQVVLPDGDPVLRMMAMPSDTHYAGDMFGGWVMAQVDMAGSLPAARRARGRVMTVAVDSFVFKSPLFAGDLVSFYAEPIKIGRTSIKVSVAVYAQRGVHIDGNEICTQVAEAVLTYVAVDENRKPRVVLSNN